MNKVINSLIPKEDTFRNIRCGCCFLGSTKNPDEQSAPKDTLFIRVASMKKGFTNVNAIRIEDGGCFEFVPGEKVIPVSTETRIVGQPLGGR